MQLGSVCSKRDTSADGHTQLLSQFRSSCGWSICGCATNWELAHCFCNRSVIWGVFLKWSNVPRTLRPTLGRLPTWSFRHCSGRNLAQRRKSELRGAMQLAFPRHSPDRSRNEIGASALRRTCISGRGTSDRNTDKGEVGGSSPPRPTINPECLCGDSHFCRLAHYPSRSHLQLFANFTIGRMALHSGR